MKARKARTLHREQIVGNVRKALAEVDQYFADVASWNDNAKGRGIEPIDVDPDGELTKWRDGYRAFLASEDARPLPPLRARPSLPLRPM